VYVSLMNAFMIDQFFSRLRLKWSCQLNQTVSTQNNSSAKMRFLYKWTPRQGEKILFVWKCRPYALFLLYIKKKKKTQPNSSHFIRRRNVNALRYYTLLVSLDWHLLVLLFHIWFVTNIASCIIYKNICFFSFLKWTELNFFQLIISLLV